MTTATLDRYTDFGLLGKPTASVAIADTKSDIWGPFLISKYASHSASISSGAETLLVYLLDQNVVIKDIVSVSEFLEDRLGLVSHLYEAPDKISRYFGESPLELGIFLIPMTLMGSMNSILKLQHLFLLKRRMKDGIK